MPILLVGPTASGKTSILRASLGGSFFEHHAPTRSRYTWDEFIDCAGFAYPSHMVADYFTFGYPHNVLDHFYNLQQGDENHRVWLTLDHARFNPTDAREHIAHIRAKGINDITVLITKCDDYNAIFSHIQPVVSSAAIPADVPVYYTSAKHGLWLGCGARQAQAH